jgi:Cdc6-like AAA superfamily ATPase
VGFLFGKKKNKRDTSSEKSRVAVSAADERAAVKAVREQTKQAAEAGRPGISGVDAQSLREPGEKFQSSKQGSILSKDSEGKVGDLRQRSTTPSPVPEAKSGSIVAAVAAQNEINRQKQDSEPETTGSKSERKINDIQFRTLASDRPNRNAVPDNDFERASLKLREVFAPSAPVLVKDHFAGRTEELERAISSIENERMHLVIYGKRGWGKTSFVNTLSNIAKEAGYIVCRISCNSDIKFSDLFRNFLNEIPLIHDRRYITGRSGEVSKETLSKHLPDGDFGPRELTDAVSNLAATRAIFVIDEYDRVQDPAFTNALAETIKNFSDQAIRISMIIVGVADTLGEMLGAHESIRRNIVGLPMRLLSTGEFDELIDIGEAATNIEYPVNIRERLSDLSRQVPYFTRLLCLHSGQSAMSHSRWNVTSLDVDYAVEQALFDTKPLLSKYHRRLIEDADNAVLKSFLISIARVRTNDKGDFNVDSVLEQYQRVTGTVVSKLSVGSRLSLLAKDEISFLTKFERDHKLLYRLTDPLAGFYLRLRYEKEV